MSAVANEPTRAELDLAREAFDRTAVGLVVISTEGVFRTVNRAFCEVVGYTREELEGQSYRRFTHPDDVPFDEELLRQIRAGADPHGTVDKRFVRKNGAEVWVRRSATVVRDASGQVRFVVGAFIDLTAQRSADNALEQQMHFTRALLDAIPNPVYFKDRQGRYGVYNRAFDELFGGGRNWIGKTVHDMFGTEDAREHHERDRPLLERPASTTYEMLVPTAAGDTRQMLYNKVSSSTSAARWRG